MSARTVRVISWMVFSLAVVLSLGQIYLSVLNRAVDVPGAAVGLGLAALGLLVANRRPQNPVGWILTGAFVTALATDFVVSYAVYALDTNPGSLPGGETMAWLSSWIFIPVLFATPAMLFLLFPNGDLLSRRWRPVLWVVILTTCAAMVSAIFQPHLPENRR